MKIEFYREYPNVVMILPTLMIDISGKEIFIGWLFWDVRISY